MDLENRLRTELGPIPNAKILILGVGNSLKADDGVGPFICKALKPILAGQVIDGGTAPENYIRKIIDFAPRFLLILDAMDFGGKAGEMRLFEPAELGSGHSSTHALSPRTFTDLISKQCDTRIAWLGIQPGDLTMGGPMTPAMENSAREYIRCIAAVVGKDSPGEPPDENPKH